MFLHYDQAMHAYGTVSRHLQQRPRHNILRSRVILPIGRTGKLDKRRGRVPAAHNLTEAED